ncbi:MAG: hypothetical protein Q7K65_04685 [Candidatus Buchananbacteria bacterium]|nr:hypothetical protein [Candidatus Buchananbacteria bacterium]
MFPVYVLEKGTKLPEEGTYYIVAGNGLFLRKDTGLIRATVAVEGISFLDKIDLSARLLLPKLSQELIVRSLLFFRAVYKRFHGEAEVQIHYSSATQEYFIHCPKQKVSAAGVDYDSKERFEGFQLVGTIHSHCGFLAFHSSIDHNDEKYFDGLHITIGHVDQPYFTISCSMMVNGNRFTFEPEDAIIGIKKVEWQKTSVLNHRRKSVSHTQTGGQPLEGKSLISRLFDLSPDNYWQYAPGHQYSGITVKADQFWDIAMPEGQDYRHVSFPKSWLERVSEHIYPKITLTSTYVASAPVAKVPGSIVAADIVSSRPAVEAGDPWGEE